MSTHRIAVIAATALLAVAAQAPAQQTPFIQQTSANWPPASWPTSEWPDASLRGALSEDAVNVAPKNFKLLWQNDKLRLVEVTIAPGEHIPAHIDPYPAAYGFDTPIPEALTSSHRLAASGSAPPNKLYPTCATVAPQRVAATLNDSSTTEHYYRVEFKRIDGYGFEQHWREWYPWMSVPPKLIADLTPGPDLGPPFSQDFPYPIAYDSVRASPKNHYLRYEDDHVRFIEVLGHPGGIENMHGHPYPSIFVHDTNATREETAAAAAGTAPLSVDHRLNPDDPRNSLLGNVASAPELVPLACRTMDPQAPHQNRRYASFPVHFYRLEYKRFDGAASRIASGRALHSQSARD